MAQTALGARKVAAKKLGISLPEYETLFRLQKYCWKCKTWKPKSSFFADNSRFDKKSTKCAECCYSRITIGPTKRERADKIKQGISWCRDCKDWMLTSLVRRGICKAHRNAYARRRYRENKRYQAERKQHSYSRKRGVDPIPPEGQEVIYEDFDGKCAYCGSPADTWDHIVPVSEGGETKPWNIVPACRSCNSRKKSKDIDDWLQECKSPDWRIIERMSLEYC